MKPGDLVMVRDHELWVDTVGIYLGCHVSPKFSMYINHRVLCSETGKIVEFPVHKIDRNPLRVINETR